MSGLIWSALGQSLGQASSTIGNLMYRDIEREDRQEERRRELEERRAYERDREALYRRTAEQQMASRAGGSGGGGGGGGLSAADIAEGGSAEGMLARSAGMTVPELRALRRWNATGDSAPFMRNVERDVDVPDPENPDYNTIRERRIAQELPPGFDREARAKALMLARIEESLVFGKDFKGLSEGRETMQGVDFANRAASNPASAGVLGQAMAVREGKPLIDEGGGEMFNQYTGASRTTPKGESEIGENRAQASQANAAAGLSRQRGEAIASGGDPDDVNAKTADLQRQITSARARLARELGVPDNEVNSALNSLKKRKTPQAEEDLKRIQPFVERYDSALQAMQDWSPGKRRSAAAAPPPPPPPSSGPGSASRPPLSSFQR